MPPKPPRIASEGAGVGPGVGADVGPGIGPGASNLGKIRPELADFEPEVAPTLPIVSWPISTQGGRCNRPTLRLSPEFGANPDRRAKAFPCPARTLPPTSLAWRRRWCTIPFRPTLAEIGQFRPMRVTCWTAIQGRFGPPLSRLRKIGAEAGRNAGALGQSSPDSGNVFRVLIQS